VEKWTREHQVQLIRLCIHPCLDRLRISTVGLFQRTTTCSICVAVAQQRFTFQEHLDGGHTRKLKASKSSDDGGKQRSEETVAETSKQRAETSNETRQEASEQANEQGQDLGDQAENRRQQRVELGTQAEHKDEGVDGGEDLADEGVDESDDGVEVALADVQAGSVGELLDEVLEDLLDLLELGLGLGGGVVLGDVASLGGIGDVTCVIWLDIGWSKFVRWQNTPREDRGPSRAD
jgi:hypothetical protein